MGLQRARHDLSTKQQSNVTKFNLILLTPGQVNKSREKFRGKDKQLYVESQLTEKMVNQSPQEPSSWGLDASFFYRTERGGEGVNETGHIFHSVLSDSL